MLPFILLIFFPAIFCFAAHGKDKRNNRVLYLGNTEYIQNNNLAIPVFFFLFFLMLALRSETVGSDVGNYKRYFELFKNSSLANLKNFDMEYLYKLLNWGVSRVTDSFQGVLVVSAAITVAPIYMIYRQQRSHSYLQIVLFLGIGVLSMFFSGIRQSIAMSIGMVAYHFVKEKRLVPFLLCVLTAIGFHHSAFILLLMYPVYHATFKKKHLWIVVPVLVATFVFRKQVFLLVSMAMSRINEDYAAQIVSTGAYGSLVLFALFAVFSYLVPDEQKMDKELLGLRNFLLLSVALQCFALVHTLTMRFNYYYLLFIPILIPRIIDAARTAYKQVAKLSTIVLSIFFTVDYARMLYIFHSTGKSSLYILPYVPFWRG